MTVATNLIRDIQTLQRDLDNKKTQLAVIQNTCQHNWSKPVYDPIYKEGYTIPGYPGMGSHPPQPDHYVSATSTSQWTRTCQHCQLVQKTTRSKKETVYAEYCGERAPAQIDVPDFS